MGKRGREIVGMDVNELIDRLNRALANEWLAYYQYWLGSKIVVGPMKGEVAAELIEHATDELRHADLLAARITQLGGTPLLTPQQWYEMTNCGYDAPEDPFVRKILEQNINGERCAITTYKELMEVTKEADPVTYQMAFEILRDEVEHEDDLQALQEDIEELYRELRK